MTFSPAPKPPARAPKPRTRIARSQPTDAERRLAIAEMMKRESYRLIRGAMVLRKLPRWWRLLRPHQRRLARAGFHRGARADSKHFRHEMIVCLDRAGTWRGVGNYEAARLCLDSAAFFRARDTDSRAVAEHPDHQELRP